jgi:hypothetical protein
MVAGVTIRGNRQAGDSDRVSAANTARSAQDSRGLLTWRRNTVTSGRSMRISALFDCALRASSPSQAVNCRKIRYSSRTTTTDDHGPRPRSSDAAGHRRGWPVRHPQVLCLWDPERCAASEVTSFREGQGGFPYGQRRRGVGGRRALGEPIPAREDGAPLGGLMGQPSV